MPLHRFTFKVISTLALKEPVRKLVLYGYSFSEAYDRAVKTYRQSEFDTLDSDSLTEALPVVGVIEEDALFSRALPLLSNSVDILIRVQEISERSDLVAMHRAALIIDFLCTFNLLDTCWLLMRIEEKQQLLTRLTDAMDK